MNTAANLAVIGLLRKGLAERREVHVEDDRGNQWEENNFFVTGQGQDWLVRNQEKLNLRLNPPETSTQQTEIEITDDDIPVLSGLKGRRLAGSSGLSKTQPTTKMGAPGLASETWESTNDRTQLQINSHSRHCILAASREFSLRSSVTRVASELAAKEAR